MHLNDFDFDLPEELIAQSPASPRDSARLLVYHRETQKITDDIFRNLGRHLPPQSTIVLNNSKVEKSRLLFGNTEIFIVRQVNDRTVEAMVRPGKKFKAGKNVALTPTLSAKVTHVHDDGLRTLVMDPPLSESEWEEFRLTPFPPYIAQNESLASEYQTVYARDEGSKAAPTAGLHFTETLLKSLRNDGFQLAELTLHVGLGTFAPVKTDTITDHKMHDEWFSLSPETAKTLSEATHITAIGTTSARTLESISGKDPDSRLRSFRAGSGSTDIFIYPGYRFKAVDALVTNFHLPKSTLLMLVSALTGLEELHRIYRHAISEKYRFYSFGDAMLII